MNQEPQLAVGTDPQRYGALFRISEALSACGEPEELCELWQHQQGHVVRQRAAGRYHLDFAGEITGFKYLMSFRARLTRLRETI